MKYLARPRVCKGGHAQGTESGCCRCPCPPPLPPYRARFFVTAWPCVSGRTGARSLSPFILEFRGPCVCAPLAPVPLTPPWDTRPRLRLLGVAPALSAAAPGPSPCTPSCPRRLAGSGSLARLPAARQSAGLSFPSAFSASRPPCRLACGHTLFLSHGFWRQELWAQQDVSVAQGLTRLRSRLGPGRGGMVQAHPAAGRIPLFVMLGPKSPLSCWPSTRGCCPLLEAPTAPCPVCLQTCASARAPVTAPAAGSVRGRGCPWFRLWPELLSLVPRLPG